jgi:tetrahydromethanopterin S-methyltransferase subunit B
VSEVVNADLPEFGALEQSREDALVGLDPLEEQSGDLRQLFGNTDIYAVSPSTSRALLALPGEEETHLTSAL